MWTRGIWGGRTLLYWRFSVGRMSYWLFSEKIRGRVIIGRCLSYSMTLNSMLDFRALWGYPSGMTTTEECWVDVPGWPYEVSLDGRVRKKPYFEGGAYRDIVPHQRGIPRNGSVHLGVSLRRESPDPKGWCVGVHHLLMVAFEGVPFEGAEVNHIDGDKGNNHYSNLEWVTRSENMKHAYRLGLVTPPSVINRGSGNSQSKLSDQDVREIRSIHASGSMGYKRLSKKFGVSKTQIMRIVKRIKWAHLT